MSSVNWAFIIKYIKQKLAAVRQASSSGETDQA